MSQSLEMNPSMGSPEAHLAVMKTRLDTAKANYDRAIEKNISPEAVQTAKAAWETAQNEYNRFMSGNLGDETDVAEKEAGELVH